MFGSSSPPVILGGIISYLHSMCLFAHIGVGFFVGFLFHSVLYNICFHEYHLFPFDLRGATYVGLEHIHGHVL